MNKNFKKIIATVAALAMASSSFVAMAATYPDVTPDAACYSAVEQLSALGIMEGFDDGTFKPEEKVTRAQMAKLVVGAKNLLASAESNTTVKFNDVPATHWAVGYVAEGVAQQIINGTSDTTFDPDATVTFAQATKMLVNAAGYEEYAQIAGGWPNGYLTWGSKLGVNVGITGVGNDTELTRAQVAQMLINAMKAPVLVVDKYTTDNGVRVPEYKQMDGEEGRKFESLLTSEWDTYEVYGKVDGTNRSGAVEAGKVDYLVDKSKNFDGAAYTGKYLGDDTYGNPVYSTADVNNAFSGKSGAEDFYLEYTYALINVNDDDEATIVYIESAGKSVYQEFDAKLYVDNSLTHVGGTTKGDLELYKSESSTSKKTYELSPTLKFIVNGVEVTESTAALLEAKIESYLDGSYENAYLVDTVSALTPSTDKVYDYLILDAYKTDVVSEIITKNDGTVKVVTEGAYGFEIDPDDEDTVYSFVLTDGTEIEATDLVANDVLSIQADNENYSGSKFYNVIVSRDTAEGKVTAQGTNAAGDTVYTIGDAEYELLSGVSVGMLETYTLFLDKDGNVAKAELLATSVNYAIVDRFYTAATGEDKVRLVLKDGSKVDYVLTTSSLNNSDFGMTADGSTYAMVAGSGASTYIVDTGVPAAARFVEYTVNKSNEVTLKAITHIATTDAAGVDTTEDKDEYNERAGRIGSFGVADTSVILNASEFALDSNEAVTVVDKSTLVDEMEYVAVALGKRAADGTYPMIVLLTGNTGFTVNSELQIALGVTKQITDDGSTVDAIPVFAEDGTKKDLVLADGVYLTGTSETTPAAKLAEVKAAIAEGVAFVAAINSKGEAETLEIVLGASALASSDAMFAAAAYNTAASYDSNVTFTIAPVIKKYASGVALVDATSTTAATGTGATFAKGVVDSNDVGTLYTYAADAKAYCFDGSVRAGAKVSATDSVNEIAQSVITNAGKNAAGTRIEWKVDKTDDSTDNQVMNSDNTPAYAVVRVYEQDVQEIYSVVFE